MDSKGKKIKKRRNNQGKYTKKTARKRFRAILKLQILKNPPILNRQDTTRRIKKYLAIAIIN